MAESKYENEIAALRQDLKKLRGEFSHLLEDMDGGRMRQSLQHLQQELRHRMSWMKDRLNNARAEGHKAVQKVEGKVEQRPLASLLLAALAGMIISRAISRR